ncbi:MAG: hypothetical protein D6795_10490 [Deltaproteobacteria bacterium]|nr:MAG: hypothetical protein D6795_10490 [Deltaproteobacteria bacterium]
MRSIRQGLPLLLFLVCHPLDLPAQAPEEEESTIPADYERVVLHVGKSERLPGYRLAYRLYNDAEENPVRIRRIYWIPLADAMQEAQLGRTTRHKVLNATVFIEKEVYDEETYVYTFHLPSTLIDHGKGELSISLETNLQVERTTDQEYVTWPVTGNLELDKDLSERRTLRSDLSYTRTFSAVKDLNAPSDGNGSGNTIRGFDRDSIVSKQDAAGSASYLFGLLRGSRIGRFDAGLKLDATWERDTIAGLRNRLSPTGGVTFSIESEKRDDLRAELSFSAGATIEQQCLVFEPSFEEFITVRCDATTNDLVEEVGMSAADYEAETGQSLAVTISNLVDPIGKGEISIGIPLYQLEGDTLVLFEAEGSLEVGLENPVSTPQDPRQRIFRSRSRFSLTFDTPFRLLQLRAEANLNREGNSRKIRYNTLTWDTAISAVFTVTF